MHMLTSKVAIASMQLCLVLHNYNALHMQFGFPSMHLCAESPSHQYFHSFATRQLMDYFGHYLAKNSTKNTDSADS